LSRSWNRPFREHTTRREFFRKIGAVSAGLTVGSWFAAIGDGASSRDVPNVVVFTVDDMDLDSVNIYGCPVAGMTPNMDRLARQGMRFQHAHVNCAVCQPARQSMMTGKHTHTNGTLGFMPVPEGVPNLSEILMGNGCHTASFNKDRDYKSFKWSYYIGGYGVKGFGRDPKLFVQSTREAIRQAREAGKPAFIGVNTSDPHRAFAGSEDERRRLEQARKKWPHAAEGMYYPPYDDVCSPDEAYVPPYLPDLPDVRKEMAEYFNTVHRADATLGVIMDLLEEEGIADNTLFFFFSDNGAAFPTSKQNCYPYSTRTPLMVRWPGVIEPGSVDDTHMVSTMDIMPTVLEACGIPVPGGLDGRSMLSILKGDRQKGRDFAFTTYNYIKPALQVYPMRAIHTKEHSYIFNAWSDGKTCYNGENMSGLTFKAMQKAAESDAVIAARVKHVQYRVPEELYDRRKDPWCLANLVADPAHAAKLAEMKAILDTEMARTNDPLLPGFRGEGSIPAEWYVRKGW